MPFGPPGAAGPCPDKWRGRCLQSCFPANASAVPMVGAAVDPSIPRLPDRPARVAGARSRTEEPAPRMISPPKDFSSTFAIFLDFDGTLVDLAPRPDAVQVSDTLRTLVAALSEAAGGALAIITGREIAVIDAFLSPLILPVAGLHGAERRAPDGTVDRLTPDRAALDTMRDQLADFANRHQGVLLEDKGLCLALHTRARPELMPAALSAVTVAMTPFAAAFELQPGKQVMEVRPRGVDKGAAIAAFLADAPFRGRRPIFVGDDRTDEPGFAVAEAAGGFGIKIGPGETAARYRLGSVNALHGWLATSFEVMA